MDAGQGEARQGGCHAFLEREYRLAALAAAGAFRVVGTAARHGAGATATYLMKISTPTIHDIPDTWADNFGAAVEKDSGGRIKVHVYPASQLGSIPRQIEGTQFGSIQMEVVPPEFMVGLDPRFEVMAAPALVDYRPMASASPPIRPYSS